jgi:hypothetical protein
MEILFNSKCGPAGDPTNAAVAKRQYHYVLLLYISVQLIHVYCTETLPSFQFGI